MPLVVSQTGSQTAVEHGSVRLEVMFTAHPPPRYQWFRNGEELLGEMASTLTIDDFQLARDEGTYVCVATNKAGYVTVVESARCHGHGLVMVVVLTDMAKVMVV